MTVTYARKQLPKYCLHKASGRAFVRIEGKMYYLGKYGSQISRQEYDRIIGEFITNGRQDLAPQNEILVENLIARFLEHMERNLHYSHSYKKQMAGMLTLLNNLYGKQPVSHFDRASLKAIRQQFVDKGLCRATINGYVGKIRKLFDWGCDEEIIPADIALALRTVRSLEWGRTAAIDYNPIEPIEDAIVEKTLPHLTPVYRDMVQVQRLIGGRPQDVRNMRFCDIDTSNDIWKYTPLSVAFWRCVRCIIRFVG